MRIAVIGTGIAGNAAAWTLSKRYPVTVYDRANLHELATGQVIAVDSQIDTTTGTVKVRAQFDNGNGALFPSQFVNARLLVKTLKNAVTVSTAAIQRGAPGAYVYLVNPDSTVSVRQISVGEIDGNTASVNSGLAPGDRVVIDGTDRLRDGLRVSVVAENGQPTVPAAARGKAGGQGQNQGPNQDSNQGQSSGRPQAQPSTGAQ